MTLPPTQTRGIFIARYNCRFSMHHLRSCLLQNDSGYEACCWARLEAHAPRNHTHTQKSTSRGQVSLATWIPWVTGSLDDGCGAGSMIPSQAPLARPVTVTAKSSLHTRTYLFMYFGPVLNFSYYHSHNGTSVGCSKGKELLVGRDITIP